MSAAWLLSQHEVWARCDAVITSEATLELLAAVADTPAPSGSSSLTRGPKIRAWCDKQGMLERGATLRLDAFRSGCDLLAFGDGGLRMLAHLDEVSYLVEGPDANRGCWRIAPYCYHLAEQPAPARVIRFESDGNWQQVCAGDVSQHGNRYVFETGTDVLLAPGDRIALASDVCYDPGSGVVTGSLDNAAGTTSALLAAAVLSDLGIPFSLALTDEEEGPSGSASQTISRGASRLLRHLDDAPLSVAIDIHGVPDPDADAAQAHRVPWGASLAEFSSHGRGSVAPPHLFAGVRDLLCGLQERGLAVRQNVGGYVPRSDDVVAMTHSNRIVILGYPGANRHFDRGLPTVNLQDLMHLARALVMLAVAVDGEQLAVNW